MYVLYFNKIFKSVIKVWKKSCVHVITKTMTTKNKKQSQMYINIIDIRQKDTRQKYHCGINILSLKNHETCFIASCNWSWQTHYQFGNSQLILSIESSMWLSIRNIFCIRKLMSWFIEIIQIEPCTHVTFTKFNFLIRQYVKWQKMEIFSII